jgi:hypothetical protein
MTVLDLHTSQGGVARENSVLSMEHFIKRTRVTKDKPGLILLDIDQSHLDLKVLDLARENGVVMLFPPRTPLTVQPSDRSVYGPCKKFVNSGSEARISSNPGKKMAIYDILFIVSQSLPNALTPKNVK